MSTFSAIFLIIGSFIGAGFATGKEIFVFYGMYGFVGLANLILSAFVFYFVLSHYLQVGKKIKVNNFSEINVNLVGKPKYLDFLIVFCFLIVTSALFAGASEFDNILFQTNHFISISGLFTLVVAVIITIRGLKGLVGFCNVVIPIIILFFVTICITALIQRKEFVLSQYCFQNGIVISACNAISYVGINTILSSQILFDVGARAKNIKKVVFGTIIIFSFLVLIAIVTLISSGVSVLVQSMPLLTIAISIHPWLGYGYVLVMWFAIITSLTANIYSISNYLLQFQKRNWINVIGVSLLCYAFSYIGFNVIVEFSYPLIGAFGIVYYILLKNKYGKSFYQTKSAGIKIHNKV